MREWETDRRRRDRWETLASGVRWRARASRFARARTRDCVAPGGAPRHFVDSSLRRHSNRSRVERTRFRPLSRANRLPDGEPRKFYGFALVDPRFLPDAGVIPRGRSSNGNKENGKIEPVQTCLGKTSYEYSTLSDCPS